MIKNKKTCDLLEKEKEYQDNEGFENKEEQSTDSEEDEETASEKSQSQKTEKMIWKRKATTRIATLKAIQSYSERIQIRVNSVKAQTLITLRSCHVQSAFGMITMKLALSAFTIFLWTGNI